MYQILLPPKYLSEVIIKLPLSGLGRRGKKKKSEIWVLREQASKKRGWGEARRGGKNAWGSEGRLTDIDWVASTQR